MKFDFREAFVANWPIKLTAFALAAVLWAAVAAQEPTTQLVPVTLNIETPPGRVLTQRAPEVQALVTGTARDMFKLYTSQPVINKLLPETRAPSHTLDLSVQDINHTTDVSVTVQDIRPRQIERTRSGSFIFAETIRALGSFRRSYAARPISMTYGERKMGRTGNWSPLRPIGRPDQGTSPWWSTTTSLCLAGSV